MLLQFIWNGIASGLTYALLAVGITLVYGLAGVVNFAVGEFVMLGGLTALSVSAATGSVVVGLVAAVLMAGMVGVLSYLAVFRQTLSVPFNGLIASMGLSLVLQSAMVARWGNSTRYERPPISGVFEVGSVIIRRQLALNALIAAVAIGTLYAVLRSTRFGASLRAVADDTLGAKVVGINTRRIVASTFVIAAVLAGLAGWLTFTSTNVGAYAGSTLLLRGFAVALLGGLGNVQGAAVAGVALGVIENVGAGYGSAGWSDAYLFGAVAIILIVWPTGLVRGHAGAHV